MPAGIPFEDARQRYRPGAVPTVRSDDASVDDLLKGYHPDHGPNARVALSIGVNRGEPCQPDLARYLQANALIVDIDIAGAQVICTDDPGARTGDSAQRCAMVSRSWHWECGGNQALFAFGRCPASRFV